jgi:hypothetical protein
LVLTQPDFIYGTIEIIVDKKGIHDLLNAEGVEVTNKKSMKWRTYSDSRLKNAPETSRIAALAVYIARQQVIGRY